MVRLSLQNYLLQLQPFAGKKKGQKSGNTKKKNSKCKKQSSSRKSKTGGSDLTGKLLSTMEKHKEVRIDSRILSSLYFRLMLSMKYGNCSFGLNYKLLEQ